LGVVGVVVVVVVVAAAAAAVYYYYYLLLWSKITSPATGTQFKNEFIYLKTAPFCSTFLEIFHKIYSSHCLLLGHTTTDYQANMLE